MILVKGQRYSYRAERPVATTNAYQLFLAREEMSDTGCLLQVSHGRQFNGGLMRAAYILDMFAEASRAYDEAYRKHHDGKRLHYDRLFPVNIESFVDETEHFRINALAFTDVEDVARLLPLANLLAKDRKILDLKTGAWMMGRLLKLLGFAHEQGVAIRALDPSNILLDTDQHFAIVPDWASSLMFPGTVDSETASHDVMKAARVTLLSYGMSARATPNTLTSDDQRYVALLRTWASGDTTVSAVKAHREFYDLLNEIWPTEFHPFTTLPR